jgi:phosphatidylethanolamine/phosphatidyl-N-methylethanolamine N-methyltransferase
MSRNTTAERALVDGQRVERVYSVLSRVYDGCFDRVLGPGRRQAIAALPLRAGQSVLEVGVGTGLSLPHYPPDCRVSGIDICEPMLERARERATEVGRAADLRLMDARDLAFGDASFDHVVAPYVISVVPEPARVMAEIRRVCRPGGTVIVVNHFRSDVAVLGLLDRGLTPLSQWLGFRMDLPVTTVTSTAGLRLVEERRVNLPRLWRLLRFERV